ncbi:MULTISPECIES: DUF5753 domain-containing protein [Nocardia]|uniref:Transcriptional regulator n=1 Tax=Nocardia asteroides NBRC 15531 TaxID=1110697 RepID=U5EKZ8_NOCAS|nr:MULTISPECIES: DUF5753 domain-containing protein [Nocardia]UGT47204.1 DUF5753 domain-containing protein [Nocardia asteroides]GAD87071.1 putative transcriptional regulator [Nocardia asteroides NBRC 15531]SFM76460.1 hypothetical protein SAMN05444423_104144 [Nocardia asteroides]VEG33912.1 Uncharacterised protein [Nocardia asteroides]
MSYSSWYDATDNSGLETLQRSLIDIESDTKYQRSHSPEILPGLLQTLDYARAILAKCTAVLGLPDDSEATAAARMQRQAVLDAPGHRFHLLIGEAALRRTVGSHAVMAAQIRQLGDILTQRDNLDIGIIPLDAEFIGQADNFVIHDESGVAIETVTGSVETTGADEIALALRTFELLADQAVYGEHARALLDRALAEHVGPGI